MSDGPLILLVDDDPDIRLVATLLLRRHLQCHVLEADSAASAESLLEQHVPDLLLVDVMMPGVTGEAFFDRLAQSKPALCSRVVFLTADARPETLDRLSALGCRGIIAKPFTPAGLVGDVESFLRHRS